MAAELAYTHEAILAMLAFSLASSSLLLINKLCIHYVPVPAFISTAQFICASATAIVSACVAGDGAGAAAGYQSARCLAC